MKIPATPYNEAERLRSVQESGLLDSGPSERFDRLTRLARRLFNAPVALVSLVDQERLWFKSCDGYCVQEVPRDISFCAHAILKNEPLIVPDTHQDERFFDNPLVTGETNVRFYAGCPVRLPDGATAGSFCIIDNVPREFGAEEVAMLKDLAAIVEDEFAVVNAATTDELTGLLNRRGFKDMATYAFSSSRRRAEPLTLACIDLDKFKAINDTWGHKEGDDALLAMAELMKGSFRGADLLARQGGDEFAILFADTDEKGAWIAMQYLTEKVNAFNACTERPWRLNFSWGVTEYDEIEHGSLAALFQTADQRLYHMKAKREKDEPDAS